MRHWVRTVGLRPGVCPLVVVHGGPGGTIYDFERLTGPLLEPHVPVVYYEQRGSGRSDEPRDDHYSIRALVADLLGLLDVLDIDRAAVLGISFGGELAAEFTVAHPDRVYALILEGCAVRGPLAQSPQPGGFDAVATDADLRAAIRARPDDVWELVDQATVDRFLFRHPESAREVRALWAESGLVNTGKMAAALAAAPARAVPLIDELASCSTPTLAIVGLWDRNYGVDAVRDTITRLGAAELLVLERSAHFPNLEEPDAFCQAVLRHVARHCVPITASLVSNDASLVRLATSGDSVFVHEMARHAATLDGRPLPPLDAPGVLELLPDAEDAALIAEERVGTMLGAAWWRRHTVPLVPSMEGAPEICMAVAPGQRGRGIGTALLRALLDKADRDGPPALVLNVHLRNTAALRLYMACGFKVVGAGRGWFGVAMARAADL